MLKLNSTAGDQRDFVGEIVDELKKGGPLKNPFILRYEDQSQAHLNVHSEVQGAIDAIRRHHTGKPRPRLRRLMRRQNERAADVRKAARLLRKIDRADLAEQLGWQEPPPRATDPLKYYCADESYFLMEMFSAKAPTFSAGDPYQVIAQRLYEAATGHEVNVERACDWILRQRRKVRRQD